MTLSNSTGGGYSTAGWTCYNCKVFVPYGASHSCGWNIYPQPVYPTYPGPAYPMYVFNHDPAIERIEKLLEEILELLKKK